ncbi:MAG TPA: MlaD family protein [Phycisphaerae bacterium]|jgi:phospholipid/cholesterol/gamma-HCH transport system substrate-binding protein|nr:MCE family protein [Phycisphaerae bacterium]HOB76414.1 MlaD family protein [Phycisphaerae bacterium]HPU32701.1 MlaD family protein [Phycisphaerae bacterium]HQA45123.1 MlaD family protein [Phycisphaerae bacterium]HQE44426.1 MlaD family protein [Phycisphaerae bacterium]
MNERRRNVIIGIFVLGGLTALAVLIIKFGEASALLQTGYEVQARFDRVLGMREGITVTLAGVSVGRIKRVDLLDRQDPSQGAVVVMEIRSEFPIPSRSVALAIQPLMGQPAIQIVPPVVPTEPLPRDGTAVLAGRQLNALSQIIDQQMMATVEKTTARVGQLAEALTPVAHDLHVLFEKRTTAEVDAAKAAAARPDGVPTTQQVTANLYTAVERLHNVLTRIEEVVGDPAVQSNFKDSLANLRVASEDARQAAASFREFSGQARQVGAKVDALTVKLDATLDTTHSHIDKLGRSLLANSDKMSKLFDQFILAGRQIAEGDGTVGMLLRDPKLYDELLLTVRRLKDAAADLQALIRTWQRQGLLGQAR